MAKKKVRVAIIGVGNCASALVQGVQFYKDTPDDATVPGLMHVNLGGYHVRDIEFTMGIDINVTKVEEDLADAIFPQPNNTFKFCNVPKLNVPVMRGMTHDSPRQIPFTESLRRRPAKQRNMAGSSRRTTKTDVVVNFLPVGSEEATKWYVEQVIAAGCAFVNGIPVFIASQDYWAKRFREANLPVLGDDIKSQ